MYLLYRIFFGLNVRTGGTKITIYIREGSTYFQAMDTLDSNLQIKNLKTLKWIAEKKDYPSLVKPGRYVINKDMSYVGLINLLRSGSQTPVNVTFNNIRTLNDLAGKIGKQILADSTRIITFLSEPDNYKKDGFTRDNVISVFIPNTYQFFWNTTAEKFYLRMLQEYRKFWNEDRLAKAKEKNLNPVEVAILASIIDDEVRKPDEKPKIAGVYLNRLRRGIPLQACPSIKFALNDFTITRVLKKYLEIDSPYNTYKHYGFPPGPIGCPTIEGIDAVLNAEKHDYLFFAAKADFSGYHNFSRTLAEHNRYAAEYQRELNKRKIFR
ncbi:MAG: endolytic transglycosylase MltG [Bacteroidales bacterium]|nr:endolytic transglycosylase MltG [Bacteroidales bacterium]